MYIYSRDDSNPADMHAWYLIAVDLGTGSWRSRC